MDSLTHHSLNLALDEFGDVDTIYIANDDEVGVDLRVQLRADILAIEGHGLSRISGVKKNDHAGTGCGYRSGRSACLEMPVWRSTSSTRSAGMRPVATHRWIEP